MFGSLLCASGDLGCCNPKRASYRFIGLFLMGLLGFGSYFCLDTPAALQDYFKTDLNMSNEKYVWLYSIYSWPNVIMCFIGGYLLDTVFGLRWGSIIYMALTLAGQILFSLATFFNAFWWMMIGRFIFGIGIESLSIAQYNYAVIWFRGKELNMIFGVQLSFGRIGSAVNFLIMENVYGFVSKSLSYRGPECVGVTLFFATLTCVASMISLLLLFNMDRKAEKVLRQNEDQKVTVMKLENIKDFTNIYWLVTFICVAYYISVFPFLSLAKEYFMTKYELEPATANTVTSLLYSISTVASPFFGILIDKTGKNILWLTLSIIGALLSHGLLAFTYLSPYVGIVILGLTFSLFASSIWTMIAAIVPEHQLGTAYGSAHALLNLGLAVTPIICGIIVDRHGYFFLELFFLLCLSISLVAAVVVFILDRNANEVYSDKST